MDFNANFHSLLGTICHEMPSEILSCIACSRKRSEIIDNVGGNAEKLRLYLPSILGLVFMMTSSNRDIFRYWPFGRWIHQSPVDSPNKGRWRRALMFSLICAWTNGCANNQDADDLRRNHAHYDVTVLLLLRHDAVARFLADESAGPRVCWWPSSLMRECCDLFLFDIVLCVSSLEINNVTSCVIYKWYNILCCHR